MSKRIRVWGFELALLLVAVALAWALPRHLAFTAIAENWAQDFRASYYAPHEPTHPEIVVVAITEDTLARFPYRFPVDRGFLAQLMTYFKDAGVKLVAFDILFDQPTEAAKDAAFREAALAFPTPVITGWTDRQTGLTEKQWAFQHDYLKGMLPAWSNTLKDVSDSTIRRIFPGREEEDGSYRLAFGPAIAKQLGIETPREAQTIRYRITGDSEKPAFRQFPAHAVPVLPKAWFRDKIVLVGADLPFDDRHRTPLAAAQGHAAGVIPGVVIHAHGLAQLLARENPPRGDVSLELLSAALLAAIAIALSFTRIALVWRFLLAGLAVAGFLAINFLLFRHASLTLPVVSPVLVFAFTMGVSSYHAAQLRDGETRFIREAFSRYVAPSLVSRMQEHPELLNLGGVKRSVTVLFTDVEGFTGLSETLDPDMLVRVLNEYLDGMVHCVHVHGGMVDKFIGDAVMAVFGAPEPSADHAEKAIACAIDMHLFATDFANKQRAAGIDWGRTRLGVHTGDAVVGNVGGSLRFDYTAIGDTVNTGSRLEGVNKYLGTSICVSESSAATCKLPLRPIGRLVVKGRVDPLGTFTPVLAGEEALAEEYAKAYAALQAGDAKAPAMFQALVDTYNDALSRFHVKRLKEDDISDLIVMKDK